jgi:hypothetical protein
LDKAKALIGDGVSTVAGDVTVNADLDRLFATVLAEEGGLDILVAGSGRVEPEELGKITEENFDATFDLNARATLFTVQKALPLMRTGGSVILIGSVADSLGVPGSDRPRLGRTGGLAHRSFAPGPGPRRRRAQQKVLFNRDFLDALLLPGRVDREGRGRATGHNLTHLGVTFWADGIRYLNGVVAVQHEQIRRHSDAERVGFAPCAVDSYFHEWAADRRRSCVGKPSTGSPKLRGSRIQR